MMLMSGLGDENSGQMHPGQALLTRSQLLGEQKVSRRLVVFQTAQLTFTSRVVESPSGKVLTMQFYCREALGGRCQKVQNVLLESVSFQDQGASH